MSERSPALAAATRSTPERDFLVECLSEIYEPRPIPPIADWLKGLKLEITADQNTAYQGEIFDPDRCPVVSSLVFKFFETAEGKELFVMKPVQSTFTTHVFFAAAHMFVFRPRQGIMAMHTRQEMRKKKKDTFKPVTDKIPGLKPEVSEGKDESTAEEFRFSNGTRLYVGGGQSNAVLTSTGAPLVILDEYEQMAVIDGTSAAALARGRMTAQDEWRKLVAFSKPRKEARFERNDNTGALTYIPEDGTRLHVEYLSGNQLRYECPCPACGTFTEPLFSHLMFSHCNEALPGQPPDYNRERIMAEVYWQCPHCAEGKVREGPEKERWVRGGRWIETPLPERRRREKYPRPEPGRWSARFSALTDIAFDSLQWGYIVRRFLDAQGDPVKLTAFNNEIMGEPEPEIKVDDTSLAHLKRLIPNGTRHAAYKMRADDGGVPYPGGRATSRVVPCLQSQLHYIGMAADVQMNTLKWSVRAHLKDGTAPLLDYGIFPRSTDFRELREYIDTQRWETVDDGPSRGIFKCFVDMGGEGSNYYDVLALSLAHPRITGIKGAEDSTKPETARGYVWETVSKTKRPVPYLMMAAGYWERRLYEECIQKFPEPYRHRDWAPALLLPEDVEDEFLYEFTHVKLMLEKGKPRWVKMPKTAKNDWADCDRMHLAMDWVSRLMWLGSQANPAGGDGPARDDTAGAAPPVKEYKLKPRPRMA